MSPSPKNNAGIDPETSFESALKELEEIVTALERGDSALEDSIRLYERGAALKAFCETKLKSAQEKVDKIVLDASGGVGAEPMQTE